MYYFRLVISFLSTTKIEEEVLDKTAGVIKRFPNLDSIEITRRIVRFLHV